MKKVSNKIIWAFTAPQFAVGLFTAMINNYLVYFYQPSEKSGIPVLITQGMVFFGVLTLIGFIKALGHIIDAVTDPLVAGLSDKSKNKNGRRIPFLQRYAVPFGLSALLIFFAPQSAPGIINNIWLAVCIWAYYVFYTLYMIPHNALLPEMIKDQSKLVNAYTISSMLFVVGSALGYAATAIVAVMKKAGLSPLWAWRATFTIFTVIGIVLLLIPAFTIKEKEFVNSVRPTVPLLSSLKHAFSNKHFRIVTLGQLFEGTSMSFFQTCIMYYVTVLMGLPEESSFIVLAVSIGGSLVMYPFINKLAKRKGKKLPIILGCIVFTAAELVIFSLTSVMTSPALVDYKMAIACIFALFVSFPFAVLNILPGSMMADVIQYDTIKTGINQEGVFGAARSFVTKVGTSIAIMIVPSLILIGAEAGENIGVKGLRLSALVGGMFCLAAVIIFCFYNEKEVLGTIRKAREKEGEEK